ncbi:MAG: hypothetical protein AVDCRST_MAG76-57 [uncultured Acidimicrobiales bacterium]|uniref:Coenzyme Q-binding protein COQ10 START domain-containing protein n=1 Tax=uncultured Acidimicrobiales bacterium TaxID=310071 RepID=A0A6J4H1G4_9ACTN|nr:MAG: hypothetical protein AVDCRST_MAG76-57 [uncultured Acidimicrobiales bacterium]
MGLIERSVEVRAEPARVWDVLVDVRCLPKVSSHTVEVKNAPDRLTHRGERFTQVVVAVGKRFESEWEVHGFDPGRAISIEGSVGFGVRYCLTETVAPAGAGRSTLSVRIQYKLPFGPLGRIASRLGVERLAAVEAQQVLTRIAAFAEERTPEPPEHRSRRRPRLRGRRAAPPASASGNPTS